MTVSEKGEPRKLNALHRGLAQKMATGFVYFCCAIFTGFFIDRIAKAGVIEAAKDALQQNVIKQEVFDSLLEIIRETKILDGIFIGLVALGCLWGSRIILRRVAALNWSRSTTLPLALEFSSAMRKIGKIDFADQMACVYKHKLHVYIAKAPIHTERGENIQAQLYPYAYNDILILESILTTNIGKQTLCLDASEYEALCQQYSLTTKDACLIRVSELEEKVKILEGTRSIKETDCAQLTQENMELRKQLTGFQKKEQTAKGREKNLQNGEQRKKPFWRVAGPLIHKLIAEAQAKPGTKYTRPQIQAEFEKALEMQPDLKPIIEVLLEAPKKKEAKTPFDLDGWAMDFLRAALGDYVSTEKGRPKAA